ncbi:hypothetical protein AWB64_04599 [Caballeronia sordidicola]|uniref:Uncharacterized protein n=1 Tax=Caballeronia sordidicola TaxID=196367 RepID=A0A158HG72_CABSO|nr:hypothetical protein [Caballeronia sordidicola]SAL43345.1 hypothetical protein AWB64_04599 [Caballeronia sordidicola]
MSDGSVLYLAIEGLLVPLSSSMSSARDGTLKATGIHIQRLEYMLDEADTKVVVNSALVQTVGYRATLGLLSDGIRHRTIGATIPGNRLLGNRTGKRVDRHGWLEDDMERRQADHIAILDHDFRYIPTQFRHVALIADSGLWAADESDWVRLKELLTPRNST